MDKIKSIIKKLDLLFRIGFWISAGVTVMTFVVTFYSIFDSSIYNTTHIFETVNTLTFGRIEFAFSEGVFAYEANKLTMIISCCLAFGSMLLTLYCIHLIRKVLKSVLEDTLFSDTVVTNIQELAITLLVRGTFTNVASYIDYLTMLKAVDLDALFLSDKIVNVTTAFTFDYKFIVVCAVVYLFSLIFKYGVELQKLSDETI